MSTRPGNPRPRRRCADREPHEAHTGPGGWWRCPGVPDLVIDLTADLPTGRRAA